MQKITVLGGGLVGSVIARDLAQDDNLRVRVVDFDAPTLSKISERDGSKIDTVQADLRDEKQVRHMVEDAHAVVGAVPGWLGYSVLEQVIQAKKSFVDISFMPEDGRGLDEAAKRAGVVGLLDFGVAPGMSNMLATRLALDMDEPKNLSIYVGGLPKVRRKPFEYAAVFSPADVIEEYTRPARLVENGKVVVREALSESEFLDFEGVGTLEAFNSDGLRSLLWTLDVPNRKEKTLRYPGHRELMQTLRDTGFFSSETMRIGDAGIRPVDLSLALFKSAWKLPEHEGDRTVMRIEVQGRNKGKEVCASYELGDEYDPETRTTSMARTTGFPCSAAIRLLLGKRLGLAPGIHFPEALARDSEALFFVMKELEKRGVGFQHRVMTKD